MVLKSSPKRLQRDGVVSHLRPLIRVVLPIINLSLLVVRTPFKWVSRKVSRGAQSAVLNKKKKTSRTSRRTIYNILFGPRDVLLGRRKLVIRRRAQGHQSIYERYSYRWHCVLFFFYLLIFSLSKFHIVPGDLLYVKRVIITYETLGVWLMNGIQLFGFVWEVINVQKEL